jgi:hypothetical protein
MIAAVFSDDALQDAGHGIAADALLSAFHRFQK